MKYKQWLEKRVHKSWIEVLEPVVELGEMMRYLSNQYSQHECKFYRVINGKTTRLVPVLQDLLYPFEQNLDDWIGIMINYQPINDEYQCGRAFQKTRMSNPRVVNDNNLEYYLVSNGINVKEKFSANLFGRRNNIGIMNFIMTNDTEEIDECHTDWDIITTAILLNIEKRFVGNLPIILFNTTIPELTNTKLYYMPDYQDSDAFVRNPGFANFLKDLSKNYRLRYD